VAKRSKTGRPDGLTPAVERRIVKAVRDGATRDVAAAAAGVRRRTLQRWLGRASDDNAPERFRRLAEAVDQAGAQREVQAHTRISKAGADDWRAEAWFLRFVRGYPARHEHSGRDGGPIGVDVSGVDLRQLTDRELDELRQLLAKGRRDDA
jgi:hypothetical protein